MLDGVVVIGIVGGELRLEDVAAGAADGGRSLVLPFPAVGQGNGGERIAVSCVQTRGNGISRSRLAHGDGHLNVLDNVIVIGIVGSELRPEDVIADVADGGHRIIFPGPGAGGVARRVRKRNVGESVAVGGFNSGRRSRDGIGLRDRVYNVSGRVLNLDLRPVGARAGGREERQAVLQNFHAFYLGIVIPNVILGNRKTGGGVEGVKSFKRRGSALRAAVDGERGSGYGQVHAVGMIFTAIV